MGLRFTDLMESSAQKYIDEYQLEPHPEGGWYRRVYRHDQMVSKKQLAAGYNGDRAFASAILYLLCWGEKSRLHRLKSDELWHFHDGTMLEITQISPQGELERIKLGKNITDGEKVFHVVPGGYWFGARALINKGFTFVSCTVVPEFDFSEFELMENSEKLVKIFPHLEGEIVEFYQ